MTAFPDPGGTKIGYEDPGLIQVVGHLERLDVFRDPSVEDDDAAMEPAEDFAKMHGLSRSTLDQTINNDRWKSGERVNLVYIPDHVQDARQITPMLLPEELFQNPDEQAAVAKLSKWVQDRRGMKRTPE